MVYNSSDLDVFTKFYLDEAKKGLVFVLGSNWKNWEGAGRYMNPSSVIFLNSQGKPEEVRDFYERDLVGQAYKFPSILEIDNQNGMYSSNFGPLLRGLDNFKIEPTGLEINVLELGGEVLKSENGIYTVRKPDLSKETLAEVLASLGVERGITFVLKSSKGFVEAKYARAA